MADCESCANFFESPICSTCENGSDFEEVVMTNADKIRAMSDEELAEFLIDVSEEKYFVIWHDWLQSEAE